MIIGINGKMGSGKDTVAEIINELLITNGETPFENKKFAGKLKTIASILTGIPVEKFEDQEFKKSLLAPEWGTVKENPLNSITPFNDTKFNHLMSVRELLQKLGTEAMRDGLHTNVWVNALFADYNPGYTISPLDVDNKAPDNWIITDMRFPNEMEAVKDRGGLTIRITRPDSAKESHISETALDDAKFNYEILNDSTLEDLVKKVRGILVNENIIK